MRIGEYSIVIQDTDGEVLAEVERTAATGHPIVGEELVLEGATYVVERVRHEEDPGGRSRRRYTAPRLFVRRLPGPTVEPRREPERGPPPLRVIPFPEGPSRARIESVVLPPALVGALVACGYEAQATWFSRRGKGGKRLSRVGQGWFVVAGESPAEALELAQQARTQRRRIERWFAGLVRRAEATVGRVPGSWADDLLERQAGYRLNEGGAWPCRLPGRRRGGNQRLQVALQLLEDPVGGQA
jgi:hypothetical protein